MPFQKGHAKVGGRKKGTPNKVSRPAKEFLADFIGDPDVQEAVRARAIAGDVQGFFRAVELIHGRAHQSMAVDISEHKMISWPAAVATDEDVDVQEPS